ncbi:MAG: triose-phosphate isomerase [bacterium]|nr:triose-phosphate isomerase [bacterium]
MKKLIVANWKMNPDRFSKAELLVNAVQKKAALEKNVKIVLCLPYPWLTDISHKKYKGLNFGAQNVFWENNGAYTGEVSPTMLKNSGVEYVIIGHSERRRLGETDEIINKKIKATLKAGLKPILCVGEHLETRKKGLAAAKNFVKDQLNKDLKNLPTTNYSLLVTRLIVAYEPIWAISTNKNARPDKPEDSLEMIQFIKSILASKPYTLNPRVLYGGSVTSQNAKSFLQYKEIDGALVGGASLKAEEFNKITVIANNANKA